MTHEAGVDADRFEAEQGVRARYMDLEQSKGFNGIHLAAILTLRRPDANPYRTALDAARLFQLAHKMASFAVQDCNVGLTGKQKTARAKMADEAATIAGWYNLKADCYGDPRGYTMRLTGDGLVSNGWGDGFGVA